MLNILFDQTFAGIIKSRFCSFKINEEVVSIPLELSVGPIANILFGDRNSFLTREEFLREMLSFTPDFCSYNFDEDWNYTMNSMKLVDSYPQELPLCIWCRWSPRDICGLFFLLSTKSILKHKLYGVFQSTYDVAHMENDRKCLVKNLRREIITNDIITDAKKEWTRLCGDNKELRVLINGRIQGVSANFFDSFLLDRLRRKEREVGYVIGELILMFGDLHDTFLLQRIERLIQEGKVCMYQKDCNPYKSVVGLV